MQSEIELESQASIGFAEEPQEGLNGANSIMVSKVSKSKA